LNPVDWITAAPHGGFVPVPTKSALGFAADIGHGARLITGWRTNFFDDVAPRDIDDRGILA
jgi:hypothetical protein